MHARTVGERLSYRVEVLQQSITLASFARLRETPALMARSRGPTLPDVLEVLPVRVAVLAAALMVAWAAIRYHGIAAPWWRCVVELIAATLLLNLGMRRPMQPGSESVARRRGRLVALLCAVVAAVVGARLLERSGSELAMGLTWLAALALFALARWLPFDPKQLTTLAGVGSAPPAPIHGSALGLGCAAIAMAGLAMAVNNSFHLAGFLLWDASLLTLALAAYRADRGRSGAESSRPVRSVELAGLLALLAAAAVLRLVFLDDFPLLIHRDEGNLGKIGQVLWEGDEFPNLFAFTWNGFPNLGQTVQYMFVPLLGPSYEQLRLSSAAIGVLSLAAMYFWVRRWWGTPAALVATLLLALNAQHLLWSRWGFNNIHTVAVAALALATAARALQRGGWFDYFLLGGALGLGFHTYHAAKIHPLLLLAPALVLAWGAPQLLKRHGRGALLAVVACVFVIGPHIVEVVGERERFLKETTSRSDTQRLVEAHERGDTTMVRAHLETHVGGSFYYFFSIPPGATVFDAWTSVPFVLGGLWMLWHWRDVRHLITLAWLLGVLAAGMLTNDAPNPPRLVGMLPAACAIGGVVAAGIHRQLRRLPYGAGIGHAALAVWLAGAAYSTTSVHFDRERWHEDVPSYLCRTLRSHPLPAAAYTLGAAGGMNPRFAFTDCLIPEPPGLSFVLPPLDTAVLPLPPEHVGHARILLTTFLRESVPLVRYFYPQAREETLRPSHGDVLLADFALDAGEHFSTQGLLAQCPQPSDSCRPASYAGGPALPVPALASFPADIEWRGQVHIPKTGRYAFRVGGGELAVGWGHVGAAASESAEVFLPAGWHPIRVAAPVHSKSDSVALQWRGPGQERFEPLPRSHLFAHPQPIGVLGRFPRDNGETELQIYPAIDFLWARPDDDPAPSWMSAGGGSATWEATVDVRGGQQLIKLEATTPTQVLVDGELVIDTPGSDTSAAIGSFVSGGPVSLVVRTQLLGAGDHRSWRLRLLWGQPGGDWSSLAPYAPPGTSDS